MAVESIDILEEIGASFFDTREEHNDLQRAQLREGIRRDGEPIFNIKTGSDEYSERYAKKKGKKKPIDLHDKGGFYAGQFVDVRENGHNTELVIDSADEKSAKLQENYGEEIEGLADDRLQEYSKIGIEKLRANVNEKLKKQ